LLLLTPEPLVDVFAVEPVPEAEVPDPVFESSDLSLVEVMDDVPLLTLGVFVPLAASAKWTPIAMVATLAARNVLTVRALARVRAGGCLLLIASPPGSTLVDESIVHRAPVQSLRERGRLPVNFPSAMTRRADATAHQAGDVGRGVSGRRPGRNR